MKTKLKKRIAYITLSVLFIAIVVGLFFNTIFNDNKNAMHANSEDGTSFSNQPYKEYNKKFPKIEDLYFKGVWYSKTRSPIENFLYNDYYVFLYKLPVTSDKSLDSVLKTTFANKDIISGIGYYELANYFTVNKPCNYNIRYRTGKPITGHNIYFTLDGENVTTLRKSDSIYCYYAELNNFTICYNKTDTVDFFGELKPARPAGISLPIQIIFRKKNNEFYLFVVIKNESNKSANKNQLAGSEIIK